MATPSVHDIEDEIEKLASAMTCMPYNKAGYKNVLTDFAAYCIGTAKQLEDPGPKAIRVGEISVKTVGQLIDELTIMNQRIWALIDKVIAGTSTPEEAQSVQKYNAKRNEYVREIDRRLNNAIQFDPDAPEPSNFLGAKIYGS